MPVTEDAVDLLRGLGAGSVAHPGGDLLSHLVRTGELLDAWGAPPEVQLAGLCHAVYGTAGLPTPLLALDARDRLRAVIGGEAERLVHRYASCDRAATYPRADARPLPFADRFTGMVVDLDEYESAAFASITIANELDVVRHAGLGAEAVASITALVRALAVHAPAGASHALEELAARG